MDKLILVRYDLNFEACTYCAEGGHLDVLMWLKEYNFPWSIDTVYVAAKYGHLDVLKWAINNGCPNDHKTFEYAAKCGRLNILKWADENGYIFSRYTYVNLAKGGHLDALIWFKDKLNYSDNIEYGTELYEWRCKWWPFRCF